MAKFCKNCGTQLPADAAYCPKCAMATGVAPPPYDPSLIGFSQRIHDPIFEQRERERSRKQYKNGAIFAVIIFGIFQIVPFFSEDFTRPIALIVGGIVGGFGLVMNLMAGASRKREKTWDGEVVDKRIERHVSRDYDYDGVATTKVSYNHIIEFALAGGGHKKMLRSFASDAPSMWDMMGYLNIGDKVRYHGRLSYYEKYDKSRDVEVPCAGCKKFTDIRLDYCPTCKCPIIKP